VGKARGAGSGLEKNRILGGSGFSDWTVRI
jgi:hypothetical protein